MANREKYLDFDEDFAEMFIQEEYTDCSQEILNNIHEMSIKEITEVISRCDSVLRGHIR